MPASERRVWISATIIIGVAVLALGAMQRDNLYRDSTVEVQP